MSRRALLQAFGITLVATGAPACGFLFPLPGEVENEPEVPAPEKVLAMGKNFTPGERWLAEIAVEGVKAGVMGVTVGDPCKFKGKRTFTIRSMGASAGLIGILSESRSDMQTLLDATTGLPIRSVLDVFSDGDWARTDLSFRRGSYRSIYKRQGKPTRTREHKSGPAREVTHDLHTVLGMLRSWSPPPGTRGYFYEVIGRRLWRTDVTMQGLEKVDTRTGEQSLLRVDGAARRVANDGKKLIEPPRRFSAWFTDDEARVPVKLFGQTSLATLTADLVAYVPPGAPLPADLEDELRAVVPEAATCPTLAHHLPWTETVTADAAK